MSRFFSWFLAWAQAFASKEMAAAAPYVETAVSELPADVAASKPLVAFTHTVHAAVTAMSGDYAVVPSLTGVLAGAAASALQGFAPGAATAAAPK